MKGKLVKGGRTDSLLQDVTLADVVSIARKEPSAVTDRWLGQRAWPRTALVILAHVQFRTGDGFGRAREYPLRDVCAEGIGLHTQSPFTIGDPVLAHVTVNGLTWSGEMRVAHCTETVGGYKVGLRLHGSPASAAHSAASRTRASTQATQINVDEALLAKIRAEARKAIRAYHRAYVSWGLLGNAVQDRIRRIVASLPGEHVACANSDQRRHERVTADSGACVVLSHHRDWKVVETWLRDVSEHGVGLVMPDEIECDPAERELAGEFRIHAGLCLIVGLGLDPEKLWVPGEVVHCSASMDGYVRVGIKFATPRARKFFES